ncbi:MULTISPECIES: gamma-glutamyltransferase [unclassified Sphingomonas]|uniref:gamma-glutamyltransferase n=1 Tax=unclassified Sphingomonas TaxID=196159 RepID=UPI002151BD94|nr:MULTISPECIES: gamma-glutamyltransferase [unclassified Sphingomonas]MCR5871196.1 gamma-glutamyltransferase [Sphingomonas sp. J344]UUY00493.1 gamma-glutamyltransferase [Sphingomonas sp. J315]
MRRWSISATRVLPLQLLLKHSAILALAFLASSPVTASAQGVVSAADPRAAEAGVEILRAGGSATDAALAMMLALTVVEPQSSGIGGGGFFVHHDARHGLIDTIDGRERAPSAARPDRFLSTDGTPRPYDDVYPGGLSVGIPGNIRLMEEAHRRWGKLPWARLFEPAIRHAEQGFAVSPMMARFIARSAPRWKDFPETQALYAPNGHPLTEGATVRNPALAGLLTRIAREGADAFYRGQNADAIIAATAGARRNPAQIIAADMAGYTATSRNAVCIRYRIYKVCGMGPPSSGATTVFGILGMIERFDIARLGPRSPDAWHVIAEAMRLSYADRGRYIGDPDFVSVPLVGLIDPDYLARRSRLIRMDRALPSVRHGNPPGAAPRGAPTRSTEAGTTHFSAVDAQGNVVAMTSTIEDIWGSQLMANGMMLNNELTDFSFVPARDGLPVANRVEAGKRPLSSMSPTIVYDANDRPILALGSAGGPRIIMHVTKTLIGVLDFGLPVSEAIALPNLFFDENTLLMEPSADTGRVLDALRAKGHSAREAPLGSKVNAVEHAGGAWRGAADPRSEGVALAQ